MSRSCTVGVHSLLTEASQLLVLSTRNHMNIHIKASHNQGYSILLNLPIWSELMARTWQISTRVNSP